MAAGAALALAALLGLAFLWSRMHREDPELAPTRPPIVEGVFAEDRLWLRLENGKLVSLRPDAAKPEPELLGGKALGLCRAGASLVVLVEAGGQGSWQVQTRSSGKWNPGKPIAAGKDELVAFGCDAHDAFVTNRRLLTVAGDKVRETALSRALNAPIVRTTMFADSESLWVGFNDGEWGGGLVRIRRADGKARGLERNVSGTICGGPLNGGCDAVNAITASPHDPGCIVAALGMVHMMSHGRIVELCGNRIRRLYYKAEDPQPPYPDKNADEPANTVAFFGVARVGPDLRAVGTDGLYRFTGSGLVTFRALPRFEDRGGYRVSFAIPGVVLVLTDVNAKAAMSGSVPLLVMR